MNLEEEKESLEESQLPFHGDHLDGLDAIPEEANEEDDFGNEIDHDGERSHPVYSQSSRSHSIMSQEFLSRQSLRHIRPSK